MSRRLLLIALLAIPGVYFSWLGFRSIANARAAAPVPVSGILLSYNLEGTSLVRGDAYSVSVRPNDASSIGSLSLHAREFHPRIPELTGQIGTQVVIWYDNGTYDLIAIEIGNERYAMDYFSHPRSKYWDLVAQGFLLGVPGFLILAGIAVWVFKKAWPRHQQYQPQAPRPIRKRFQSHYPRSPIPLARDPAAIVADFKIAVSRAGPVKARPDSLLQEKREEIIEALFDDVKRKAGAVTPAELDRLKTSLKELQTFVPAADAALVARYEEAQSYRSRKLIPGADRKLARGVLARIEAGQNGVANFRYDEPQYLNSGANFMIEATLKWADPIEGQEKLEAGSSQGYGLVVYAAFGLTATVLYFAGAVRWGSIQFWALALGAFVLITLAIVAAPVFTRIEEMAEDFGGPRQYLLEGLLLAGLVAASIGGSLMLVLLVNAVAFSL